MGKGSLPGYYTLMASLPHLPAGFDLERLPIGWPRLRQRLAMLPREDEQLMAGLAAFLRSWTLLAFPSEQALLDAFERLAAAGAPAGLLELLRRLLDMRALAAALSCRSRGLEPPRFLGRYGPEIRSRWQHPSFGLGKRFPWIDAMRGLLAREEAAAAHALFSREIWKVLASSAEGHFFDLEAVALYLCRWDAADGWVSRDPQAGTERLENLIREALGEYAELFR